MIGVDDDQRLRTHNVGQEAAAIAVFQDDVPPPPEEPTTASAPGGDGVLSIVGCVKSLLSIAFPSFTSFFLIFAMQTVNMAFVGHYLGAEALGSVSVAITFYNVTSSTVGNGMGTALDTLCSQEYGRDKRSSMQGIHLQRFFIIDLFILAYSVVLFYKSETILSLVFSAELSRGAATYLRWSIVTAVANQPLMAINRFLLNQTIVKYTFYSVTAAGLSCPLLNLWLIRYGLAGASLASAGVSWVQLGVLLFFCARDEQVRTTWGGWNLTLAANWQGIRHYLGYGFPAMLGICSEWWAFETLMVFAGRLGDIEVASLSVIFAVYTCLLFALTWGLATAINARVGNALGQGNGALARRYARVGFFVCVGFGLNDWLIAALFHRQLYGIYTSDPRVLSLLSHLTNFAPLMHLLDNAQVSTSATYRACGKQSISAAVCLVSVWCVGVVGAYLFTFQWGFGVTGILLGMICGLAVEFPILRLVMQRFDWDGMASKASVAKMQEAMHKEAAGEMEDKTKTDASAKGKIESVAIVCSGTEGAGADDVVASTPLFSRRNVPRSLPVPDIEPLPATHEESGSYPP